MFRTVKRIIDWCGEFRKKLYAGFVFSLFSYWAAAAPAAIAAYTISVLITSRQEGTVFERKWIWLSAALIAAAILLRFFFDYMRARFQETISYELVARDRLAVGDALKRVSLGYFQKADTGNILNSITTGLLTLENMGIRLLDTFIGGYINYAAILIWLAVMSPSAALISAASALVSFAALLMISAHSSAKAHAAAESNRDLTSAALEYARGLSVVKTFGQSGAASEALKSAVIESRDIHQKIEWGFIPGNCLHLLALKAGSAGIAAAACIAGISGDMELPFVLMLIFFSFIITNSLEPVSDSAHTLAVINDAMDQLERLRAEDHIDKDGRDIKPVSHDIVFDHVDFGYDKRRILKDVSFTIPEKTSAAVVGPSGSGKTTLVNLIARFYDVQSGSIKIGGHDVREFTCDSLLSDISMVFQNVYLFNDTIRANICFGNPDASEEEMIAAAEKACCHDFISSLPDGYDTIAGEGGSALSGGEKQRISIARAILKDAPVIILDEATASVDPENEHLIQNAISELTKGKTVITIAHRLATVENADQIIVIDNGRAVQNGTHKELIAEDGLYRRFIDARHKAEGWTMS